VNHPGGVCWGNCTALNVTPDIVPGDKVTMNFGGVADSDTTVADAFAALVGVAQAVGNGVIWFVIVWLPALIGLGIVFLIVRRLTPGLRSRIRRQPKAA